MTGGAELFQSRSYALTLFEEQLQLLLEVFANQFAEDRLVVIEEYINAGLKTLNSEAGTTKSFLSAEEPYSELAADYLELILNSNKEAAYRLIQESVENGTEIKDIYLYVFEPIQKEIGRLWQMNELSVATEHYCTGLTQLIMSQLYPYILNSSGTDYQAVTTCVGDELHELGVRMIADLLELEGWDTFHIGANTPREDIIETVIDKRPDLVCISVTIANYLDNAAQLIERLREIEEIEEIKIMVGGYPFNIQKNLWQEIGADGYAPNAQESVVIAEGLVEAD